MRIATTRTGRPTIRARTRRRSARKRLSHRHRRLSHRRGFPSHRDRRRPRGDGVEHELARRLAAAGLSALAAFRRFCRVAASLDQSGPAERCGRGLHCWSWAGVLRELLRRNALALLLHCTACVRVPTLSSGSGLSSLVGIYLGQVTLYRRWLQRDRTSSRGAVRSVDEFAPMFYRGL